MNGKQKQKVTTSDDRHCDRFVQKDTLRTSGTYTCKY